MMWRYPDLASIIIQTTFHKKQIFKPCPPIMDKEQLWNMYPECFDGMGKFKDF